MTPHLRSYLVSYLLPLSAVVLIGVGQSYALRQELWTSHELRDHLLAQHHDLLALESANVQVLERLKEEHEALTTSLDKLNQLATALLPPQEKVNLQVTETLNALQSRIVLLERSSH